MPPVDTTHSKLQTASLNKPPTLIANNAENKSNTNLRKVSFQHEGRPYSMKSNTVMC